MVLLGGLEVVAAGYLIHKHNQNKKERQRIQAESAALEEQQYRIFPSDGRHRSSSRHRRSHSRERRDGRHRRRHSTDGKYRREDEKPPTSSPAMMPPQSLSAPVYAQPPPYAAVVPTLVAQQAPPQDIKYGWTDEQDTAAPSQQPNGQYPPTGWPAHWAQTQTTFNNTDARLQAPSDHGRRRGRSEGRASSASPHAHVRFAEPTHSPAPSSQRSSRR